MRISTVLLLLSSLPAAMAGAQSTATAPGDLPGMQQQAPAAPRVVLPAEHLVIEVPKSDSDEPDAGPWAVAEAAVKGNVNLKPKTVIKAGKARKGRVYMKDFVQDDIEAILALGSVDKVSVDIAKVPGAEVPEKLARAAGVTEAVRVTYIVTEKPIIRSLEVSGNKGLSKGRVKDEMTLKKKDYFDELKVREDLIKIADMYREKGYIDIQTDYEVKFDSAASACDLTIKLKEGNKARVADVRINGAEGFPVKKLVKKFKNRPKKIYAPQELSSDIEKLKEFYKNNGYADFSVDRTSTTFNENRSSATIDITITEGKKIKFGGTYFSGNSVYLPSDLLPLVEYRRGKYFSQEKLDDTVRALQDKYADKGYLKAVIVPQRSFIEATGETDITFLITENSQIYVDHIDVEGNKATKTYVLRREITQKEREVFSSSKIRRSQEKIFNLGFIDDVAPVINPTPDPDKVDLVFDVTEGKPGMLTAGAGISSTDGLVGTLSMSHMNLFGRAQRTSLSWNFGKRVQDYYLSWMTPWVGDHPTSLGVDVFNTRHYKPYRDTISAYTERRTGGKISLGPRFQEDKYQLRTSYTYEKVRITGVDQIYQGELQEGTSVTSSVYVELTRDTRDNVWDPTKGTKTS
ncbi:MAG: outer membrane protein assembly factor BamA, partial [Elusimicrobia bacterium]|nr:outer membrane protein assembly factor BamA [Elusimicrobiota bacterium]